MFIPVTASKTIAINDRFFRDHGEEGIDTLIDEMENELVTVYTRRMQKDLMAPVRRHSGRVKIS